MSLTGSSNKKKMALAAAAAKRANVSDLVSFIHSKYFYKQC